MTLTAATVPNHTDVIYAMDSALVRTPAYQRALSTERPAVVSARDPVAVRRRKAPIRVGRLHGGRR